MRADTILFSLATQRASRKPQFIIKIEYEAGSIYLTSHTGIPSVPGDVIEGVVQRPSSVSQHIYPDQGRSDIGAFTFTVIDQDKQLTEAFRAQLQDNGAGIRGNRVKFYLGYAGFDFPNFTLFTTQIVTGVSYYQGRYTVKCADITREQRTEIFEPVSTTLTTSITAGDLVILVNDASRFQTVAHGSSYSDAPNRSVLYIRIEDEIIRCTGTTASSFLVDTGGRGVFNTRAAEHAVDPATPSNRRTKVEEFIYLEMPGPKLALAVLTGQLYGTSDTLPDHWNLGIEPTLIRESDFLNIGPDLWNPADDSDPACFIARFDGLKSQTGTAFLEKEIYLLLGCFSPVYADGTLGLRRRVPVIADAAPVVTLNQDNIVSLGELEHDFDSMHNFIQVLWAYDEIQDDFLRRTAFIDEESIAIHGRSQRLDYSFKGLHSQRAGDSTIAKLLDSMRDAYNEPPQRLQATVLGSLNGLEVGDIARVRVPENILRDFVQNAGDYNRSFEVQQRTYDAYSGDVTLELFGSTSRPLGLPFGDNPNNLPDAFYNSSGTALGTIITITSGTAATGSFTLTGNANLKASGSIFYYLGDLTIPQGCNITISANVQLRIMGFLTLNGTITGSGNGLTGVTDDGSGSWDTTFDGHSGFIGGSRGWDGVLRTVSGHAPRRAETIAAVSVAGKYSVFPQLLLSVVADDLVGLPDDMRGTGGAPGGRVVDLIGGSYSIKHAGGAGANGGAGLCIICRGMAMGASAQITLDGSTPATPTSAGFGDGDSAYFGSGGAGGPGAFLLLLDGDTISVPTIDGTNFSAKTGTVTQPPDYMPKRSDQFFNSHAGTNDPRYPFTDSGYADERVISGLDFSAAARLIMYVPPTDNPVDEDSAPPPAPTNLNANHVAGGNLITYTLPADLSSFDTIEIWASIDNDRTNAVKIGETRGDSLQHNLPLGGLRYYWARSRINPVNGRLPRFSAWTADATEGKSSNADTPGEVEDVPDHFVAVGKINGIQFNWSLPAYARLLGQIELWEFTSATPFSSATRVWEGYGPGYFHTRTTSGTRYYWIRLRRGEEFSVTQPPVTGLPGDPSSITSNVVANASPTSLNATADLFTGFAQTATTTVTASGGTGPYTYAWAWLSGGSGITIDSPTAATTSFSGTHAMNGAVLTGTARCTATDSLSATAVADVAVLLNFPSIH